MCCRCVTLTKCTLISESAQERFRCALRGDFLQRVPHCTPLRNDDGTFTHRKEGEAKRGIEQDTKVQDSFPTTRQSFSFFSFHSPGPFLLSLSVVHSICPSLALPPRLISTHPNPGINQYTCLLLLGGSAAGRTGILGRILKLNRDD